MSNVMATTMLSVGETLATAVGHPVAVSVAGGGAAGELVANVSPEDLTAATGALLGLGARHLMLVAYDGDSARRAGAAPAASSAGGGAQPGCGR